MTHTPAPRGGNSLDAAPNVPKLLHVFDPTQTHPKICLPTSLNPHLRKRSGFFQKRNKVNYCGYLMRLVEQTKCKFLLTKAKSLHFPLTGTGQCHSISWNSAVFFTLTRFPPLQLSRDGQPRQFVSTYYELWK